ncbi:MULTISPECIES: polyribonucleotide nucleotidyltransferase [Bifidobacterium]|uniref:Polyribonucleotide nucleotidyltransferase n=1 Tax=Bifidobacterium reuteri DSM 23975 TaxID=1437610 RepID=A0A087CNV5_9BIFI|nr:MULTISPECIES: polyribonucleotide nucleotidyltransferase [Bifidobacterium]KFI84955.1 guanosine pentaphosphate synthetase I/polyribonucleotide nucleotidyltransferase [Bifidobacterium reuteri DSM 23975]TPF77596.1 polynucleotide phosphorylase [Bifidobacterium sp. UTCIF-1]TPF79894.1 polynucleotide phosphorylase [Bifidobacterium sp. UTCIF-24]TPF81527.1 polynucleotide phosphorylase [Bifidobacterium sp. UTCIF-3]TPF84401.1 polynucleotide phosphorylase [Bifidobacterium sp. UTCIF-36]
MEGPEIKAVEAVIDNGSFGKRTLRFETGRLAQQADGAVAAYLDDDSMILSTTTAGSSPKENYDFFPLTVDVEEKMYAAGKIPGSFFRREGRPSSEAILACRIIDRPLRPLFPHTLRNEVQVVETVLAVNPDDAYDVIALNAASASTMISGLPFSGPVSGVRLALIDGQWVAFPRWSERERAVFELVVAGRVIENGDVAIAMIEAGAGKNAWHLIYDEGQTKPDETVVAQGLEAAKPFIKVICDAQNELKEKAAKETKEFELFPEYTDELYTRIDEIAHKDLDEALSIAEKLPRQERIHEIKEHVREVLANEFPELDDAEKDKELGNAFKELQRQIVRRRILTQDYRIDGRGLRDIRTLSAEVDIVPRVHGSALFQRGETQILGVTTLNMLKMEQQIDALSGPQSKRYMHNYEMPPYSTGETGRVGSPKRREIGHGALAEKALVPVLPSREEFPYAIRQVSEAIGSNGSTSMGSVCASTLSLLAAGVPLKAPVAGIAMGLVSGDVDGQHIYKTLTDILGAEDAFGDMDFKVAGTSEFITALQLDTKLDGIPADILAAALQQAKEARTTILEVINECIDGPAEMSEFAPRIITTTVPVEKIGEVIGPKGKMINQIQEDTGAEIAIEDDGTVFISSEGGEAAEKAKQLIDQIANPHVPEAGETYNGKVVKTTSFGAFVNLTPGTDGLLHISQIRNLANGERIDSVEDVLKEGDTVEVVVQGVDDRGKISLAIPGFEDQESGAGARGGRGGDRDDRRGGARGGRDDRRGGARGGSRGGRDDRGFDRDEHADRDFDRDDRDDRDVRDVRDDDRPRRRRPVEQDDRDFDDEYDDRPRRRRSADRDFDRDDDRDDARRGGRRGGRGADRDFDRDDRDDDRPRRRRSADRGFDRDDRRSSGRGRGRGSDRNPRYATDDNYDDYRADREERSERPRRRVRRDFDPFED